MSAEQIAERISVIIPTLNEAATIATSLRSLEASLGTTDIEVANVEVIVVDGGSQDESLAILSQLGYISAPDSLKAPRSCRLVLTTAPGRAAQMNAGAALATGEILLFLHADTLLPPHFPILVRQALAKPGVIAGAFALAIAGDHPGLRVIERTVNWRSRWWQLPYGDQALFLRADRLHQCGGFPQQPIMEDYALVQHLRQRGTITIVPQPVLTSARRWEKLGLIKTTLINQLIVLAYHLGISPDTLATWYRARSPRADVPSPRKIK